MINKSKFQFQKATSPLKGDVCLLGDKSLAHRAMLFAALAKGRSVVTNFPDSGVTQAMIGCLQALGVQIKVSNCILEVEGLGLEQFGKRYTRDIPICDCKNSATTMRLLLGALVGAKAKATVIGSESLSKRPIRVDEAFRELQINAIDNINGNLPAYVHSSNISFPKHAYKIKYNSAQVKSALILAALCSRQNITLQELVPTRDHTERMLKYMGLDITKQIGTDCIVIESKKLDGELNPLVGKLPSDPSSAAFILAAAALVPESEIVVHDVLLNENRTRFLDFLGKMGCICEKNTNGFSLGELYGDIKIKAPKILKSISINDPIEVSQMIDEFPMIAALMAKANGISTIRNAKELRFKESDRIKSILCAYDQMHLKYHEYDDGFTVEGSQCISSKFPIETFNDHRIAMAFSLLGLVGDIAIDNKEIINESFVNFIEIIENLSI